MNKRLYFIIAIIIISVSFASCLYGKLDLEIEVINRIDITNYEVFVQGNELSDNDDLSLMVKSKEGLITLVTLKNLYLRLNSIKKYGNNIYFWLDYWDNNMGGMIKQKQNRKSGYIHIFKYNALDGILTRINEMNDKNRIILDVIEYDNEISIIGDKAIANEADVWEQSTAFINEYNSFPFSFTENSYYRSNADRIGKNIIINSVHGFILYDTEKKSYKLKKHDEINYDHLYLSKIKVLNGKIYLCTGEHVFIFNDDLELLDKISLPQKYDYIYIFDKGFISYVRNQFTIASADSYDYCYYNIFNDKQITGTVRIDTSDLPESSPESLQWLFSSETSTCEIYSLYSPITLFSLDV